MSGWLAKNFALFSFCHCYLVLYRLQLQSFKKIWEVSISLLASAVLWYKNNIFICTVLLLSQVTSSYLEAFLPSLSIISLSTMNTLQATSLLTEVNLIKIISYGQASLHPLCESHSSIYLFCEGFSVIHVDIHAHHQSPFSWGALHWIVDTQFPDGIQSTETTTNAENHPTISDIAMLIHTKHLEENCICNGRCACCNWV